jgi:hypothetical protein
MNGRCEAHCLFIACSNIAGVVLFYWNDAGQVVDMVNVYEVLAFQPWTE